MAKTTRLAEAKNQANITDIQILNIKDLTNDQVSWSDRMHQLNGIAHRYMQAYLLAADDNPTYCDHTHPHGDMQYDMEFLKELIDTADDGSSYAPN